MPQQPINFGHFYQENYNTPLFPSEEIQFQAWLQQQSIASGRDVSRDLSDYDLRGYWRDIGQLNGPSAGHMTDFYKKPNHPTFSTESYYSGAIGPQGVPLYGGQWGPQGQWYMPSQTMLQYTHPQDFLQRYMKDVEPNVELRMPQVPSSNGQKRFGQRKP